MENVIHFLRLAAVMIAAAFLGNWFIKEVRMAKASGKPLTTAYFSLPGILILLAILTPILIRLFRG